MPICITCLYLQHVHAFQFLLSTGFPTKYPVNVHHPRIMAELKQTVKEIVAVASDRRNTVCTQTTDVLTHPNHIGNHLSLVTGRAVLAAVIMCTPLPWVVVILHICGCTCLYVTNLLPRQHHWFSRVIH